MRQQSNNKYLEKNHKPQFSFDLIHIEFIVVQCNIISWNTESLTVIFRMNRTMIYLLV